MQRLDTAEHLPSQRPYLWFGEFRGDNICEAHGVLIALVYLVEEFSILEELDRPEPASIVSFLEQLDLQIEIVNEAVVEDVIFLGSAYEDIVLGEGVSADLLAAAAVAE